MNFNVDRKHGLRIHQANQKKTINFGRFAANAVMLHVVASMTNVINELTVEGIEITGNMKKVLSSYRGGHINRYGVFPLSMNKEKLRVEYRLN